ncbi:MAG TPA: GFA family protein [Gaiellales bacterium]|nr:GFA family protein [Gaiellales bacterium]
MTATGRCLCGAVSYRVSGPLRDVLICHCGECRRWHGHVCAATAAAREHVAISGGEALRFVDSPAGRSHARRGFCQECGSSLFWDAPESATISIAAGTLDPPTGLRLLGHIHTASAGDYYDLPDDGLPRRPRGWADGGPDG